MAGWLNRENDGSGVKDCLDTLQEAKKENNGDGKVEWPFTEFLKAFFGRSLRRLLFEAAAAGYW